MNQRSFQFDKRFDRRGASTATLLVGTVLFFALGAMVVDLAIVRVRQLQLLNGCDRAASAAAARAWNCTNMPPAFRSDEVVMALLADDDFYPCGSPIDTAQYIAGCNEVGGKPIELVTYAPDEDPDCPLDVHITIDGGVSTVTVYCERSSVRESGIELYFAKSFGRQSIDLRNESVAVLDQRVGGFEPYRGNVTAIDEAVILVPILPILVEADGWQDFLDNGSSEDQFQVDQKTGEVKSGSDNIPELKIRICDNVYGCSEVGARLVDFEAAGGATLSSQIRYGVDAQISLFDEPELLPCQNKTPDFQAIGQPWAKQRVLAIAGSGPNADRIQSFGAVHVLKAEYDSMDGTTIVTVQPTLLQTCTAQNGPGLAPANPWIGKVYLAD